MEYSEHKGSGTTLSSSSSLCLVFGAVSSGRLDTAPARPFSIQPPPSPPSHLPPASLLPPARSPAGPAVMPVQFCQP